MPIDAAFLRQSNGKIYFFKGDQYVRWTPGGGGIDSGYPKSIGGNWPGLPDYFTSRLNATLMRGSNGKIYFFKGKKYIRYSRVSDGIDSGYPKLIDEGWTGVPYRWALQSHVFMCAVHKDSNARDYFFKGGKYTRFHLGGVDQGYESAVRISIGWPGLFGGSTPDAAFMHTNGKMYFFKSDEYIRWTPGGGGVDSGYPKKISSVYSGLPHEFTRKRLRHLDGY